MIISDKILSQSKINWNNAEWLQTESLKEISPESFNKLKTSISKNGFIQPFNIWIEPQTNIAYILDGHHRKKALTELRNEGNEIPDELPCNVIDCESREEAIKFLLLYSSTYAITSKTGLEEMLDYEDLSEDMLNDLKMEIDIPDINLDELFKEGDMIVAEEEEVLDSEVEEDDSINVKISQGDVLEVMMQNGAKGILVCGDCKSNTTHELWDKYKVEKARLCLTDPPYNVGYVGNDFGKEWDKIENDKMKPEDFYLFISEVFAFMNNRLVDGGSMLVFYSYIYTKEFRKAFEDAGFHYSQDLIWDKTRISFDRYDFHYQTEPIMYGWKKGMAHQFLGDAKQNNIFASKRPIKSEIHPTMKPVDLLCELLAFLVEKNEWVCDFFSGSGSTMVACLQKEINFFGSEFDEKRFGLSAKRISDTFPEATLKLNGVVCKINDIIQLKKEKSFKVED